MRFGDRGSLRRSASHLRDEAVATERATRRAGSHLESLVAAAGRYEAPSAHALLTSWQAPASTFRRLIDATDDAFTDKGEKAGERYREQREAMHLYLAASKQAHDDIAPAYATAAMLLQVVESNLARSAHGRQR